MHAEIQDNRNDFDTKHVKRVQTKIASNAFKVKRNCCKDDLFGYLQSDGILVIFSITFLPTRKKIAERKNNTFELNNAEIFQSAWNRTYFKSIYISLRTKLQIKRNSVYTFHSVHKRNHFFYVILCLLFGAKRTRMIKWHMLRNLIFPFTFFPFSLFVSFVNRNDQTLSLPSLNILLFVCFPFTFPKALKVLWKHWPKHFADRFLYPMSNIQSPAILSFNQKSIYCIDRNDLTYLSINQ